MPSQPLPLPVKVPSAVQRALREFAGHKPVAAEYIGVPSASPSKYCHEEVRRYVETQGSGEHVFGWLLQPHLASQGTYAFIFHSVWRDFDGDLHDVVSHDCSVAGASVFVSDTRRRYDFEREVGYNGVQLFTTQLAAMAARMTSGIEVQEGRLYWSAGPYLRPLKSHDGRFKRATRHIDELESRYGAKAHKGGLLFDKPLSPSQHREMVFNYSVS